MDFQARQYDPQLGRFLAVDPLADEYGQEIYSPYAAMGNNPSMMVDPNGQQFQVATNAPGFLSQVLDSWLGAGNYSMNSSGWITVCEDKKVDAIAAFTNYLMGDASYGRGGSSAATQSAAKKFATTFVENIMNPNVIIKTKTSNNGIADWDEITYSLPENWEEISLGIQNPQMCAHYVAAYVERGLNKPGKRDPNNFKSKQPNVDLKTLEPFLVGSFGRLNVWPVPRTEFEEMSAYILSGSPGIAVEPTEDRADGHQVAIIGITVNLKDVNRSGAKVYNPQTDRIEQRENYFSPNQESYTPQLIYPTIFFIK